MRVVREVSRPVSISLMIVAGLLISSVASPVIAQEPTVKNVVELPDDFDKLIQTKSGLLTRFRKLRQSGPRKEQVEVLFTIVSIHRKALTVAIETKREAPIIKQLQDVYLNDGEFLASELGQDGNYKQAAELITDLKSLAESLTGKGSVLTQRLRWKSMASSKLAEATKEQQVAYRNAINLFAAAQEAIQTGRAAAAEQALKQLVDVEVAVIGENHPDVAFHMNELGRAQFMQQKFELAEKTYGRSLSARKASTGQDLQFATTLFNMGRLYQDTKRLDEAEKQYLAAAEIEESLLGPSNESVIQTLKQLASVYEATGNSKLLADLQTKIAAADPFNAVLSYSPRNTYSGFILEPASMLKDPSLELIPFEVIEATCVQEFGFNPLDAEAIAGFFTLPIEGEPEIVFAFRLKSGASTNHDWSKGFRPKEVPGATFLSKTRGEKNNLVKLDDGTYLIGTDKAVEQALTATGPCLVTELLAKDRGKGQFLSAFDIKSIRGLAAVALAQAPPVPQPFEQLKTLPAMIDGVHSRLDLSNGINGSMTLIASDEAGAKKSAEIITRSLQAGIQMAIPQIEQEIAGDEPVERASRAYMTRIMQSMASKLQPTVNGNTIEIESNLGNNAGAPVLIALLLPAVQQAREAARRTQAKNSLKQMAIGMLNYHDVYQRFPAAASVDKAGKPLLSWRVHILPFIEEGELYKKFRLDEPWDSEHNLPLADEIPKIYVSASHPMGNKTIFQVFTGDGTLFPEPGKALGLADITDGASNTLTVVEANPDQAVIWTRPVDLTFDPENPGQHVGQSRAGGFQAALVDGSVRFLSANLNKDFLGWLIQPADGNVVEQLP